MTDITDLNNEGHIRIRQQLNRTVAVKHLFGRTYFFLSNWFYIVSWAITAVTPFILASLLYVPNLKEQFGLWTLIITGIGTLLSVLRTVFRFSQKAKHQFEIREHALYILNRLDLGLIEDVQLIEEMRKLGICDVNDPAPE